MELTDKLTAIDENKQEKKKITLKEIALTVGSTITGISYDIQFAPALVEQGYITAHTARNITHMIAGIGMPFIYKLTQKLTPEKENRYFPFIAYGLASTVWETTQFIQRGYFQIDQLLCDFAGISIAMLIDKYYVHKTKNEYLPTTQSTQSRLTSQRTFIQRE